MALAQLGRLLRLALGDEPTPPPLTREEPTASRLLPEGPNSPAVSVTPEERGRYLAWLLGVDGLPDRPAGPESARLLRAADAEINGKGSSTRLLRRSPSVLPRLIRILRTETYTRTELAHQIEQDVVLAAEVLRMARSAMFAHYGATSPSVQQAVAVLGSVGVEQVIARVLVRPLFQSDSRSLQARAAARMWEDSERCATLCALLAHRHEQDTFDAYVAGLLMNSGWNAMLRTFELHGAEAALTPAVLADPVTQDALSQRRDRLLARLIPAWDLSMRLNAMGRSLGVAGGPPSPLRELVAQAEQRVMRRRVDELAEADAAPQPKAA
ncbi:HDOD domain-containing protein [Ramlibacter humi]|nr:HDOD domain-containing protein [Ramlibacter humi]